ncbi:DUF1694 domain-containing protein [Streptococcus fryi]
MLKGVYIITTINQKILRSSNGETRVKPDEQRLYLGTFKERVVLTIPIEDSLTQLINDKLPSILLNLEVKYKNLNLKINSELASNKQILLLQRAQELHIPAMVVNDNSSHSPFGIVVHTNNAENVEATDVKHLFPEQWQTVSLKTPDQEEKKGFWQKLFGK